MTVLKPNLATVLLALTLAGAGVSLAATQATAPLAGPIAPFGCYA